MESELKRRWFSSLRSGAIVALALAACNSPDAASADNTSPKHDAPSPPAADNSKRTAAVSEQAPQPVPAESSTASERVVIGDAILVLRACTLSAEVRGAPPRAVPVDLPSECAFGRLPDGAVQVRRTKQGPTALIISSKPDPEHPGDCITRARGVVVTTRGDVKISPLEKSWASCGVVGPFDEPMFIVLAQSIQPK